MYILPREYVCGECGFKMAFSPSETYKFLPITEEGKPFCNSCLMDFLKENIPVMQPLDKDHV